MAYVLLFGVSIVCAILLVNARHYYASIANDALERAQTASTALAALEEQSLEQPHWELLPPIEREIEVGPFRSLALVFRASHPGQSPVYLSHVLTELSWRLPERLRKAQARAEATVAALNESHD